MTQPVRDKGLDVSRALVLIYIVTFIHVFAWSGYGVEPLRSLTLFEMPVVFFITGASLSLQGRIKGFWENLLNRGRRVLVPYYLYTVFAFLFLVTTCAVLGMAIRPYLYPGTVENVVRAWWATPFMLPYTGHLWFVPLYFILLATFPIQQRIMNRFGQFRWLMVCFFVTFVAGLLNLSNRYLVYNVALVAGYVLYPSKDRKVRVLCIVVSIALLVGMLLAGVGFVPMQGHKNEFDLMYFAFCMASLALLTFVYPLFRRIPNIWLIRVWNERGFTIYLYHNFAYVLTASLVSGIVFASRTLACCVWLISVFFFATLIGYVMWDVERFIVTRLERIRIPSLRKVCVK